MYSFYASIPQLFNPPVGPDIYVGIDENFTGRVGAYDGSDVAAVEHRAGRAGGRGEPARSSRFRAFRFIANPASR